MKLVLILGLLISAQAFAKDLKVKCVGSHNYDQMFSVELKLNEGQSNVSFAKSEQFEFFLTTKADSVVELQVLDSFEPSRSYATAKLSESSFVELAIWKRDFLIETRCSLIQ